MIDALYSTLIIEFIRNYQENAIAIGLSIVGAKRSIQAQLDKKFVNTINPLIDDYFLGGIKASNKIIKKEVLDLVDIVEVPWKYNKEVISAINTDSVFTGYYDTQYKSLYKKRETDALKRVILRAKYQGLTDSELVSEIKKTVKISKQRALNMARSETARLETAVQQIYYTKPAVNKKYEKVWDSMSDARPTHKAMDGKVANKDGMFKTPDGTCEGPPYPNSWNCRCRTKLRLIT